LPAIKILVGPSAPPIKEMEELPVDFILKKREIRSKVQLKIIKHLMLY